MPTKTYAGSCHCGAVHFEADIDFSHGTGRCNCSICSKTRNWGVVIKPDAFRLHSRADATTDYQFKAGSSVHWPFCRNCGVRPYGLGDIPEVGGKFVSVNIACLDNITPEELATVPVRFADGRHDNWWNPPAVTSYL